MAAPKPCICTWKDLSYTDAVYLLDESVQKVDIQRRLSDVIAQLERGEMEGQDANSLQNKRSLIVLDLFYNLTTFARQHCLRNDQLSGLFSIVWCVHKYCISSPYDNAKESFAYFTSLMVCHSVDRPPYSTALFTMEQVKNITDYVLQTYFKHFKLYKYAFTKRVTLSLKFTYNGQEEEEAEEEAEEQKEEEETSSKEEIEKEGENDEEAKTEVDEEPDEQEKEKLTPEQQKLQDIISASLADHIKQLQVNVEKELSSSDKRIMEKLSALEKEARVDSRMKKAKK